MKKMILGSVLLALPLAACTPPAVQQAAQDQTMQMEVLTNRVSSLEQLLLETEVKEARRNLRVLRVDVRDARQPRTTSQRISRIRQDLMWAFEQNAPEHEETARHLEERFRTLAEQVRAEEEGALETFDELISLLENFVEPEAPEEEPAEGGSPEEETSEDGGS
jgi:uncharacterized membrane protein